MQDRAAFRTVKKTDTQNKGDVTELIVTAERVVDLENQIFAYIVTCSLSVRVTGMDSVEHDVTKGLTAYKEYPAGIKNEISVAAAAGSKMRTELIHYTPKTINCVVQGLKSNSLGKGEDSSAQYTTGWSKADTNTFGISLGLGMMGPMPTGEIGGNYSNSSTSEQNASAMSARSMNFSMDASSSSTISIKDWGSYSSVNTATQGVIWNWVQEYPWSFLRYRAYLTDKDVQLDLQPADKLALFDGHVLTPPSELSMFGPDFTSKIRWMIRSPDGAELFDAAILFSSDSQIYRATHSVLVKKLEGKLTSASLQQVSFDIGSLAKLALDPLDAADMANGAVNFLTARRFAGPLNAATPKDMARSEDRDWSGSKSIVSNGNTLMVIQSKEFDAKMTVTLKNAETAALRVFFKADQSFDEVSLALKCWVQGASARVLVEMTVFPENNPALATTLSRHIDWDEGGGAAKSLLNVELRNRDYFSEDCCDFIGNGLNVADLVFSSSDGKPATLVLRALAVG